MFGLHSEYNDQKHKDLITARATQNEKVGELAVQVNAMVDGKPLDKDEGFSNAELRRYTMLMKQHEFESNGLKNMDHELRMYADLAPREQLPLDHPALTNRSRINAYMRRNRDGYLAADDEKLCDGHTDEHGRLVIQMGDVFGGNEFRPPLMAGRSDQDSGSNDRGGMQRAAPQTWSDDPVFNLAYMGDVMRFITSFTTPDGNDHHMVNIGGADDVGEIYADQAGAPNDLDLPDLTRVIFKAFDSTSKKMGVHRSAVNDVPVLGGGQLIEMMGMERIARVWNRQIVAGGVQAAAGKLKGSIKELETIAANTVTYEDLLATIYNINRAYRTENENIGPGGFRAPERGYVGWLFHDSFEHSLRSLKAQSRPLWTPGIMSGTYGMVDGAPPRLLGYPYGVTNDLDSNSLSDNAVSAMFGNFAYGAARTVEQVTVERFYDSNSMPNIIYVVWARRDFRIIGALDSSSGLCQAIVQLKTKAA